MHSWMLVETTPVTEFEYYITSLVHVTVHLTAAIIFFEP